MGRSRNQKATAGGVPSASQPITSQMPSPANAAIKPIVVTAPSTAGAIKIVDSDRDGRLMALWLLQYDQQARGSRGARFCGA